MEKKTVAIENNFGDIFGLARASQRQTDLFRRRHAFIVFHRCGDLLCQRRYRSQRLALMVRYHLRIDMLVAAENTNTRPLIAAENSFTHPFLASPSAYICSFARHSSS